MGIRDKPITPASPWQNGFAERLIGSIRRECLDHLIVFGEEHLRRILKSYADYYNCVRTHRSLHKDAPVSRPVQRSGMISSHAILGGLHHQYVRIWILGTHNYDVFNQDNMSLVDLNDTPIQSITEHGILTADGVEREFDVIVLATGFDAVSGGLTAIDIRGADGLLLRDKWATGVRAHLGVATAGFPNMLFVYGPQSPSGFCNGPTCAEIQGEMIVETLDHLLKNGRRRIEATPEAEAEWTRHVAELVAPTLFLHANSWYIGANIPGKPVQMLNYPGGLPLYRQKYAESKANNFAGFQIT
jgi:hypothetical protein